MKKIAFIFPGQGSQYAGMGKDIYESIPYVRELFAKAENILHRNIRDIMFNGPEYLLRQTEHTQPALYVVSCALYEMLKNKGILPFITAGHSLGEYSALYASGAFSFEQGLSLVELRGKLIQKSCEENPGSMAALIGLSREQIGSVCAESSAEAVNFNCPGQVVIAGSFDAVEQAEKSAKERGVLKTIRLNVSGPFHSSYMHRAAVEMKKHLQDAALNDLTIPVISNIDAQQTERAAEIIDKLSAQIDHPVMWEESILTMGAMGAEIFIEVGPGRVLTGLNRRINRKLNSFSVENIETFNQCIEKLSMNVNFREGGS
ncbi:MAG: ACP S-malonyltransferase [bacterium]